MNTLDKIAWTLACLMMYVSVGAIFWTLTHDAGAVKFYAGFCLGAFAYSNLPTIWK